MAVAWHPSIDQAVARLNQSGEDVRVAKAGYYPKISGGVDSGYNSATDGDDGWRPKASVMATQMIYDFGKVSSSVDAATAGTAISRAQVLQAVDDLVRDTAYALIEVQRNQALLKVAQDQLAGVTVIADLVKQRSDKGASTRSDEIQAQARVTSAESSILQIRADLGRWQSNLANLTGLGSAPPVVAGVPGWLPEACDVIEPDWDNIPAIMEAASQKKQAEAQLRKAQADRLPTVSLEAGVSYDLNHSSPEDLSYDPSDPQFTVGLRVTGNLFDPATGPRGAAADYALRAATAAESTVRFEIGRSLSEAKGQTGSLQRLQASLASHAEMMSETRDLYQQQYVQLGTRTLLDLLNAEQELHSAQFDRVNTEHELRKLDVDCLFSSGQTRESYGLGGTIVRGVSL